MFILNYRITTREKDIDIHDFHDIEGFFQIKANDSEFGHYHEFFLRDREQGWDLLINWFNSFLTAILELGKNQCINISDIESANIWIKLVKTDDILTVSIVKEEKIDGDTAVSKRELKNIEYIWSENISFKEFVHEVVTKAEKFICEIQSINTNLLESRCMVDLAKLLNTIIVKM